MARVNSLLMLWFGAGKSSDASGLDNRTMCSVILAPANVPSGKQSASAGLRAGFRKCLRRAYSLPISTIHHVGGRDRRNDLTGCHDRTRVVRDIDVEGSMHHLVRVVRRRILYNGAVIADP